MVSQHIGGVADEFIATNWWRTDFNSKEWILKQTVHIQLYRYHSKNHHLNALMHPFNFYIEPSPIEYVLTHYIDYWDLERDYSKPLRNHLIIFALRGLVVNL